MFQDVDAPENPVSPITPIIPKKDVIVPQLAMRERNVSPLEKSTKKRKIDFTIEIPMPFLAFHISHPGLLPPPSPIGVMPKSPINPNTFFEINEAMSMDEFWEIVDNKGSGSSDSASTNFDPSIEFNFDGLDDDFTSDNVFKFEGIYDDFDPFILFDLEEMKNE